MIYVNLGRQGNAVDKACDSIIWASAFAYGRNAGGRDSGVGCVSTDAGWQRMLSCGWDPKLSLGPDLFEGFRLSALRGCQTLAQAEQRMREIAGSAARPCTVCGHAADQHELASCASVGVRVRRGDLVAGDEVFGLRLVEGVEWPVRRCQPCGTAADCFGAK